MTQKSDSLPKALGDSLREKERATATAENMKLEMGDPVCSCCCCPYTPAPTGRNAAALIDRYVMPKKGEVDIYERKLSQRAGSWGELCCGKGCRCACECCCCCLLEEVLSDFVVTNHRMLVEQRATQRYCRCTKCCKKTPNLRASYLAHHRAASYVTEKPIRPLLPSKIRVDFIIKLCPSGERFYPAGLMLRQKPYMV